MFITSRFDCARTSLNFFLYVKLFSSVRRRTFTVPNFRRFAAVTMEAPMLLLGVTKCVQEVTEKQRENGESIRLRLLQELAVYAGEKGSGTTGIVRRPRPGISQGRWKRGRAILSGFRHRFSPAAAAVAGCSTDGRTGVDNVYPPFFSFFVWFRCLAFLRWHFFFCLLLRVLFFFWSRRVYNWLPAVDV